jgi:hypothetical protein
MSSGMVSSIKVAIEEMPIVFNMVVNSPLWTPMCLFAKGVLINLQFLSL